MRGISDRQRVNSDRRRPIQSRRVQGAKHKDDDLPGIDGGDDTSLIIEFVTTHGRQLRMIDDDFDALVDDWLLDAAKDFCLWIPVGSLLADGLFIFQSPPTSQGVAVTGCQWPCVDPGERL